MAKKRKKKKGKEKSFSPTSFKKSLRQSTHPIPSKKVEETDKKYDRKKSRDDEGKEIQRSLEE